MNVFLSYLSVLVGSLLVPMGLLFLYRRTHARSLWPTYVVLGVFQYFQFVLASLVEVDLGLFAISPGSLLLFPANLLLILLIYIKRDVYEFKRLCIFILGVNAVLCVLSCVVREFVAPDGGVWVRTLTGIGGVRLILYGTVLLVLDAVLMVTLYDALPHPRPLAVRIFLSLTMALIVDATGYAALKSWGTGQPFHDLLRAQLLCKFVIGAIYSLVLSAYFLRWETDLRFEQPSGPSLPMIVLTAFQADSVVQPNRPTGVWSLPASDLKGTVKVFQSKVDATGGEFCLAFLGVGSGIDSPGWQQTVIELLEKLSRGRWHVLLFLERRRLAVILPGFGDLRTRSLREHLEAHYGEWSGEAGSHGLPDDLMMSWAIYPPTRPGRATRMHPQELIREAQAGLAGEQTNTGEKILTTAAPPVYPRGMKDLPPILRTELNMQPDQPLRLQDPSTQQVYVLVRADLYERLMLSLGGATEAGEAHVPAGVLRSQRAYWEALPGLLQDRKMRSRWVLFHGEKMLASADRSWELYRMCKEAGIPNGEYYVGRVVRQEAPPWEPEEMTVPSADVEDLPSG